MKVNQVKSFVASNISRFEKNGNALNRSRSFNLYDKNNLLRGEYNFITLGKSKRTGVRTSLSSTHIMDENRKKQMSEFVFMNKDFVTIKDKTSETLTRVLPSEISIVTTVLDFVNNKFITVRSVSKLKNKLHKEIDSMVSKGSVVYKELSGNPKYEKTVEVLREGCISEVKNSSNNLTRPLGKNGQIPFIYW